MLVGKRCRLFFVVIILQVYALYAADKCNPFFAMGTGIVDKNHTTPEAQAKMLKELGYAGCSVDAGEGVSDMLQALDNQNLKLFALYAGIQLKEGKTTYEEQLQDNIKLLKDRKTIIWLYVAGTRPDEPALETDSPVVAAIREIAALAQQSGLKVALYPHSGFYMDRMTDAVRLVKESSMDNVGVTFNLCHWLKVEGDGNLEAVLETAMPYLYLVTVNGADSDGEDWKTLIQTLDSGTFNIDGLLWALRVRNFSAPIGLQHYGIEGDAAQNLEKSMNGWNILCEKIEQNTIEILSSTAALDSWQPPIGDWLVVGNSYQDRSDTGRLAWEAGAKAVVNGENGNTCHLFSKHEHGDVQAHIEFMVPKGSNSGVYFQGRYEIQVFDSWGVQNPQHSDCGGIYQRWVEAENRGFEGRPPRVNAAGKPGEWQSFDVLFRAPRFDTNGQKIANALFVKVIHNGIVIHENQEVTGPTRAAAFDDEQPLGPLMLQGDHGPVAYRNIFIRSLR
jgi:sugar phosphate isomerase/epimerase